QIDARDRLVEILLVGLDLLSHDGAGFANDGFVVDVFDSAFERKGDQNADADDQEVDRRFLECEDRFVRCVDFHSGGSLPAWALREQSGGKPGTHLSEPEMFAFGGRSACRNSAMPDSK